MRKSSTTRVANGDAESFQYEPLPQGIGVPKGSPLAGAIQAALGVLVENGTYGKVLARWGISAAAVPAADIKINPSVS